MRKFAGLMAICLWCVLAVPVVAADAKNAGKAADSAGKTVTTPSSNTPPAMSPVPGTPINPAAAVPVDASAQCEVAAVGQAAEIAELKKQVQALQAQLATMNATGGSGNVGGVKDMAIRIKNLPAGSYRDRCFACMTAPDEDGERVLLCTCPVGDNAFERLSITLSMCHPDEDISYCAGMLMCGPCKVNGNLRNELPATKNTSTDSERVNNYLQKK